MTNSGHQSLKYREFLISIKNKPEFFKKKTVETYLKEHSFITNLINHLPCFVYIIDYCTQKFIYMSEGVKQIVGYSAEECYEMGQDGTLNLIHPEDLKCIEEEGFKRTMDFIHTLREEEIKKCKFSLNYRARHKSGHYIQMLQQYVFLEYDEKRNPLLLLGVNTDITAYKTDDTVVYSISLYNEETGLVTVTNHAFSAAPQLLSSREKEVLKLIAHGIKSNEIADKLFVSPFTIRAHRRNLLKKTGCKNMAELINYAYGKGFI